MPASVRRGLQRCLLGLALTLLGLLASPEAFAQAPMCDEDGSTVMAPLPAPPSDDGEIEYLWCVSLADVAQKVHPGRPSPAPERFQPLHDDVALLPLLLPTQGSPVASDIYFDVTRVSVPVGYRSEVFRPPRG